MSERIVDFGEGSKSAVRMAMAKQHGAVVHGEIVRCGDCEYFDTRKCKSQWPFCLDAFCWWGKRKEGSE